MTANFRVTTQWRCFVLRADGSVFIGKVVMDLVFAATSVVKQTAYFFLRAKTRNSIRCNRFARFINAHRFSAFEITASWRVTWIASGRGLTSCGRTPSMCPRILILLSAIYFRWVATQRSLHKNLIISACALMYVAALKIFSCVCFQGDLEQMSIVPDPSVVSQQCCSRRTPIIDPGVKYIPRKENVKTTGDGFKSSSSRKQRGEGVLTRGRN